MGVWRCCWGVLSGIVVAGCGGHSLDIGSNDGGLTADSEVPSLPLGPSLDASGVTRQVWIGHLENHQFPDGSDTLTMTLDFAPGGQVTGSLLLGDGSLLQPPTDPNIGYPPGSTGAVTLAEGFPYSIQDGILNGFHLTVHFSEYEVWARWCALQTPYLEFPGSDSGQPADYRCAPIPPEAGVEWFSPTGCGFESADGSMSSIDCGQFKLCGGAGLTVCQCSAAGCKEFSSASPMSSLDLVLANTKADGTMSGDFGDYQVQFIRSQ